MQTMNKYNGYSIEAIDLLKEADEMDYLASLALYDKVISLFPEPPYAYARRGFARHKTGDFSGAIADFDEAIKRKPNAANTIWQRGIAKWKINDHFAALNDFNLYLKIKPGDPEAYFWMARIYESMGEYESAIDHYKRALDLDITYTEAEERLEKLSGLHG